MPSPSCDESTESSGTASVCSDDPAAESPSLLRAARVYSFGWCERGCHNQFFPARPEPELIHALQRKGLVLLEGLALLVLESFTLGDALFCKHLAVRTERARLVFEICSETSIEE